MSKVRIELNLPGVNEVMKSPEIQAAVQAAGEAVAAAASGMAGSEPFGTQPHLINWIAVTNIYPDSQKAAKANFEDNVLLKALGAVGMPMTKMRGD